MFAAIFVTEARAVYDQLSGDDQAEVDGIIRLLELNPWADDTTKFTTVIGRWAVGVYDDNRWEVVYRVVDDRFIEVIGFTRIRA